MADEKLLEARKKVKQGKPKFLRQDNHKRKSLKQTWRKPRGLQSKLRLGHRGKGKAISHGYRSPVAVRGTNPKGLAQVVVNNVAELAAIDPKTQGIIISGRTGDKNRIAIIKEAEAKKITILNLKNPSELVKTVEGMLAEKKKAKAAAAAAAKKQKEKKTADKKSDKKDSKDAKKETIVDKVGAAQSTEEKKDEEKKEKDKLLTQRDR